LEQLVVVMAKLSVPTPLEQLEIIEEILGEQIPSVLREEVMVPPIGQILSAQLETIEEILGEQIPLVILGEVTELLAEPTHLALCVAANVSLGNLL
jgi:hypothetical protein